jgi:DNA-binding XRE family transcriptional regulator
MKVQFKQTPAGELAIMPRAEYERLKALSDEAAEDIGTARLVARAKKDDSLRLPIAVVEQLGNGDNPIRVLRRFRGLTQAELVAGIGITQNYLSDLETGKRKGPLELHRKLAQCLGVPLDLLTAIAIPVGLADQQRLAKRKQNVAAIKRERRGKR